MQFFNKKEDVIDVQLTQYGKHLLSTGKFKPAFYAFYDDDILYNAEKAEISEKQNASQERISEVQRPITQYSAVSIAETYDQTTDFLSKLNQNKEMSDTTTQDPHLSKKMLTFPLRNSISSKQESPYFEIKMLESTIRSAVDTTTEGSVVIPIPQLELIPSYGIYLNRTEEREISQQELNNQYYIDLTGDVVTFLDNSKVRIEREDIIIDLKEENSNRTVNSYEIEIYEVVEDSEGEKLILLEEKEDVYRYFDILKDGQIDSNKTHSRVHRLGIEGLQSPDPRGIY